MKSMESKNYSRHEIGNAVKYYLSEINKVSTNELMNGKKKCMV